VLEALAIAGGPAEFANLGSARLIRKIGDRMVVIPLRLQDALKGDVAALNQIPRIQSGDTLVVP
jgi:polysaccharide biosynthesis/export protein